MIIDKNGRELMIGDMVKPIGRDYRFTITETRDTWIWGVDIPESHKYTSVGGRNYHNPSVVVYVKPTTTYCGNILKHRLI